MSGKESHGAVRISENFHCMVGSQSKWPMGMAGKAYIWACGAYKRRYI